MLWLWILGTIVLLLVLLCLLRLQLLANFDEETSLFLKIGPVCIRLLPPQKEKQAEKSAPKKEKAVSGGILEKLKTIPKPSAEDIKDAYHTLKPVMLRALRRTRRGIRIHPLTLSIILGGREDPAQTAEYYGYAHAAVWTAMPVLEQLLVIPDPAIHIGMDFDSDVFRIRGSVGVGIRIGTLILLGLGISIPALRWFLKYLKRKNAENNTHQQPASSPAA